MQVRQVVSQMFGCLSGKRRWSHSSKWCGTPAQYCDYRPLFITFPGSQTSYFIQGNHILFPNQFPCQITAGKAFPVKEQGAGDIFRFTFGIGTLLVSLTCKTGSCVFAQFCLSSPYKMSFSKLKIRISTVILMRSKAMLRSLQFISSQKAKDSLIKEI